MTDENKPALVPHKPRELAFEPENLKEAHTLATYLVKSGFLPRAIRTPEQALAILATGRELGLAPMQSFRQIHVIEGKPTLSADLMVALVKKHHECEYFQCVESTDEIATYECKRRGSPKPVRRSFTMKQARQAGITGKHNWKAYPAAMLRARAKSDLARDEFPDVVGGLYDPDELESVQTGYRPDTDHVHAAPPSPEPVKPLTAEEIKQNVNLAAAMEAAGVAQPTDHPDPDDGPEYQQPAEEAEIVEPEIEPEPVRAIDPSIEDQLADKLRNSKSLPGLKRAATAISKLNLPEEAKRRLRSIYRTKEMSFEEPRSSRTEALTAKLAAEPEPEPEEVSAPVRKALDQAQHVKTKDGLAAWSAGHERTYKDATDSERDMLETAIVEISERCNTNIELPIEGGKDAK